MTFVKVTSEDLHSLSGQVQAGSNNIQDQLSRMAGEVSAVAQTWQGVAHTQFNVLYDEWQRSAAGLKDALDGIARLLNSAGTQYQATEDAISHSMHA